MDHAKERERKQAYLRQQIVQQNHDPAQFVDYLSALNLTPDIDLLSYNEVKQAVESFKAKKLGDAKVVKGNIVKADSVPDNLVESEMDQKAKQIYYEKYGVYEDEFQRTYKCVKMDTDSTEKNISPTIYVSDPQRKTAGGFFFGVGLTSFLSFKIDTPEYKWSVRRRYSDFQWIRAVILKLNPSFVIPPLPKKNAKKRSGRDIEKRMNILSYFLNDLSNIPEVMHSRYVLGFLSLASEPQFQELKREGNNKPPFQQITSIQTENGNITIGITQNQKVYLTEFQKYVGSSQTIMKTMTASSKELQACFVQETNTLYKMGNQYADLHTLLKEFNSKVPENMQQSQLADSFVTLNNMLIEWGNIVKEQHSFIQKNFNTFIRYTRNEMYSLNDQLTRIQEIEQQFFKFNSQLQKKKDKVFAMNDFSKWDIPQEKYPVLMQTGVLNNKEKALKIMLPKETYEVDKWRVQYAFYVSQFSHHSHKMLKRQSDKFCENFKEFAITIKVNSQQLTQMWNQVSTNFSSPKKKHTIILTPRPEEKEEEYFDG